MKVKCSKCGIPRNMTKAQHVNMEKWGKSNICRNCYLKTSKWRGQSF